MVNKLSELRSRVRGCFVGGAIGDALGMPVEIWKREDIWAQYGYITDYLDSVSRYSKGLTKGQWTDDTKLTLETAGAIIDMLKAHEFSTEALIKKATMRYIGAVKEHNRGFGKTTRQSLEAREKSEDPFDGRYAKRPGNGCAMKGAPLGLFRAIVICCAHDTTPNYRILGDLYSSAGKFSIPVAQITHNDTRSVTAGVIQASAAYYALFSLSPRDIMPILIDEAECTEKLLHGESDSPRVSDVMCQIPSLFSKSDDEIITTLKTSSAAYESFPCALALAAKYENNYEGVVLACVNAGGDTDTIAAMAGALVGARNGLETIPQKWRDGLEAYDEIIKIADEFFDVTKFFAEHYKS